MKHKKTYIGIALTLILTLLMATGALADAITADADALVLNTPHPNNVDATQAGGTTVSYPFSAAIANTGNDKNDVFPGSVTVTITKAGDWLSGETSGEWTFTAYDAAQVGAIEIFVPCDSEGATEIMTVVLQAGVSTNGKSLNPDSQNLSFTITAGPNSESCTPSNTAPEVSVDNESVTVNEGDTASNTGAYSDADGDTVTLSASIGAVTANADGTWVWSFVTTDGPIESQTVTISADDGQAQSTVDFDLVVNNVSPTATFGNDGPVEEGSAFSLLLTDPVDPSSADIAAGFDYAFDCGDGSGYGSFGTSNSASCPTIDNGTRSVAGKIQDKDGGVTEYTASVTVNNANPVVAQPAWQSSEVICRAPATLTGISFSDAGVVDYPWNVDIDWADGSSTAYSTNMQGAQANQSHTYNTPGTYSATVTVTDKDGGSGSNASNQLTVKQAYTVDFLQPFDDSTPSGLIVNKMKNGRVVPVKVTIFDVCTQSFVTDPASVTIRVSKTSGAGASDPVEEYADAGQSNAGTNLFRWTADASAPGGGFWIYNLDSKALGLVVNNYYRVDVFVGSNQATVSNWAVLQPVK